MRHIIHILILLWLSTAASACLAEELPTLAIIIASDVNIAPIKVLPKNELSLIYWRKKQYWQGGIRMRPVNLHAEHPLRLQFSKTVLGSLPSRQTSYWNGLYFHGTNPPHSLQSEEAVIRFVSSTKGSIGYIDACKADARVKTVLWIKSNRITTHKPNFNCQ